MLFEPKVVKKFNFQREPPFSVYIIHTIYEVLCKRHTDVLGCSYFALFLGRRKVSFLFYDALS